MPTMFNVSGPHEIPFYQGRAGRTITDDNTEQFWKKNNELAAARGRYAFGIRASKGFTVVYIGKATKSFKQEVFSHHKLTRYQQHLADVKKGTPILFFLVAPRKRGTPNTEHINQLEDFLIQAGIAANPNLLNIRGTKAEEWGITGVLRSGRGKKSKGVRNFIKLMKIGD